MKTMTRPEFATLPGAQHLEVEITFDHGPERAAIHHNIRDASVLYVLSQYPAFDSIRIIRTITVEPIAHGYESRKVAAGPAV